MRVAKPSKEKLEQKQKEEQRKQEKEALKERLKGKKLSQQDINDLVIKLAKEQGLIAQ